MGDNRITFKTHRDKWETKKRRKKEKCSLLKVTIVISGNFDTYAQGTHAAFNYGQRNNNKKLSLQLDRDIYQDKTLFITQAVENICIKFSHKL